MAHAEIFLLAGGKESRSQNKDPLLAGIFSRLGLEKPSVAYVGAASNDNRVFFMWIKSLLKKAGAGNVNLAALASKRADPAKARSLLQETDIVFVSGGDVEAGMGVLERTGADAWLRELHRAGKPFIGVSAGSIMLAQSWVRWPDANDDASAEIFPCLGLAPLLCDTHAEKDEWQELKTLLRLRGNGQGYGIPSGAALHVKADREPAAMGQSLPRFLFQDGRLQRLADLDLD